MKQIQGWWFPDTDTHFDRYMIEGQYQRDQRQFAIMEMMRMRRKTRVAVDIGAHVGTWARPLSVVFERVLAFEPNSKAFECLVENTKGHRRIAVLQAAIGAKTQDAWLMHPAKFTNTGDSSLLPGYWRKPIALEREAVHVYSLDDMNFSNIDFIKMDVQGAEEDVLKGARKTIDKWRPVMMIEDGHPPREDLKAAIEGLGYVEIGRHTKEMLVIHKEDAG